MGPFFFHACKMKTIAAYLLAVLGGNKTPSEDDVKRILEAAAANVDAEAISKVVSELSGKSVYDVMDEGAGRLVAVSTGGSVVLLLVVLQLKKLQKKKLQLKKKKKNLMKIWDSDYST